MSGIFLHYKHSRDILLSCHHFDVITGHLGHMLMRSRVCVCMSGAVLLISLYYMSCKFFACLFLHNLRYKKHFFDNLGDSGNPESSSRAEIIAPPNLSLRNKIQGADYGSGSDVSQRDSVPSNPGTFSIADNEKSEEHIGNLRASIIRTMNGDKDENTDIKEDKSSNDIDPGEKRKVNAVFYFVVISS